MNTKTKVQVRTGAAATVLLVGQRRRRDGMARAAGAGVAAAWAAREWARAAALAAGVTFRMVRGSG
jgi:hypothetical protein